MAEVFRSTLAGETAQHFVQFVMMYQQQTLMALGQHPQQVATRPPANLSLAQAFLLQLGAIQERTRGNLTAEEERVLGAALETLQRTYEEAARTR